MIESGARTASSAGSRAARARRRAACGPAGRRPALLTARRVTLAVLILWAVPVFASDSLHVSLQLDHLTSGASGGGAAVDWHRALQSQRHLTAGVSAFSLGDTSWGFARVGVVSPLPGKFTVTAGADLGRGTADNGGFRYEVLRGALRRPLTRLLSSEAELQSVHIHTSSSTMVKGAIIASLGPTAEATVAYHTSVAGNLDARYVSARMDLTRGGRRILAGVASGRSLPDLQRLIASPGVYDSLELFAGVTLSGDLTLVLHTVQFDQADRYTALVSWKTDR